MAVVQAGMSLTRVVLLVGAGLAGGPALLSSGKISDVIAGFQEMLREKGPANREAAGSAIADMANQMAQLTREVRQALSNNNVIVLPADSGKGGVSALVAPAAAVGVVSYGYMRWKGISFSSLMYVTKQNMANAVASMTKHLEQVQSSLAAAKKCLTQRIQHVDDKLDQQKHISEQIKDEVTGAKLKIQSIGSDMDKIKNMVMGLDEKMDSIEAKQNYSCAAVSHLCRFVQDSDDGRLLEQLEVQVTVRRFADKNMELPGLGIGLLALESANPAGAKALQSVVRSARLMLP